MNIANGGENGDREEEERLRMKEDRNSICKQRFH